MPKARCCKGGSYNSAALRGGSYNSAALRGGSYNSAALRGGSYNSAALRGGSYNSAALRGGSYNSAALRGGAENPLKKWGDPSIMEAEIMRRRNMPGANWSRIYERMRKEKLKRNPPPPPLPPPPVPIVGGMLPKLGAWIPGHEPGHVSRSVPFNSIPSSFMRKMLERQAKLDAPGEGIILPHLRVTPVARGVKPILPTVVNFPPGHPSLPEQFKTIVKAPQFRPAPLKYMLDNGLTPTDLANE